MGHGRQWQAFLPSPSTMATTRYKMPPDFRQSLVALREFAALSSTVSLRSIVKHLSTVLKYITLVLLLLNARSLPLVWHRASQNWLSIDLLSSNCSQCAYFAPCISCDSNTIFSTFALSSSLGQPRRRHFRSGSRVWYPWVSTLSRF